MRHTASRTPRFDREWKEIIALLPEQRQSLMEQAIRDYQLTGVEPNHLDGAEMMAFLLIKKIVDRRARLREVRRRRYETTKVTASQPAEPHKEDRPEDKKASARCTLRDYDKIERDSDGAIIIRSSEDMQRAINYHRQVRTDPTKKIRYRYLGK